ncbi:MAG: hypothetical protein K2Z81_22720 [Cyanobacteria bacterium]|nr:hypothetical protein [Cyanobacteriota bacterium]
MTHQGSVPLHQLVTGIANEVSAFQLRLDAQLKAVLDAAPTELEAQKDLVETLELLAKALRKSAQSAESRSQKLGLTVRCSSCHKIVQFVGRAGRWPVLENGADNYVVKKCDGCRECEGIFCFTCAESRSQKCRQS